MKKQYVLSAAIALAFTLGLSTGEARAKRDLAHGKSVKEKMQKKHLAAKDAKKTKKRTQNH